MSHLDCTRSPIRSVGLWLKPSFRPGGEDGSGVAGVDGDGNARDGVAARILREDLEGWASGWPMMPRFSAVPADPDGPR